jgi:hypothetical protein
LESIAVKLRPDATIEHCVIEVQPFARYQGVENVDGQVKIFSRQLVLVIRPRFEEAMTNFASRSPIEFHLPGSAFPKVEYLKIPARHSRARETASRIISQPRIRTSA